MVDNNKQQKSIKVSYNLEWMTDLLEEDLKDLVEKNIKEHQDSYLNKILSKKDAEIMIDVRIQKNKQEKYEWSVEFMLDWKKALYHTNVPFKNVTDVVNHAFKHLKEYISDAK